MKSLRSEGVCGRRRGLETLKAKAPASMRAPVEEGLPTFGAIRGHGLSLRQS